MTELIIGSVAGMEGVDQGSIGTRSVRRWPDMQTTLDQAAAQEKNEKPEQ